MKEKLVVVLAVLMMCIAPSLVKFADAPPLILALYRMSMAFAAMLVFVLVFQRAALRALTRRDVLVTLAAGGLLGLHFAAFFASVQLGGAVTAATVLANADAVLVAAVSVFFFHKPIRGRALWGILVAAAGILTVIIGDWNGRAALLSDLAALAAVVLFTAYFLFGSHQRKTLTNGVFTLLAYGGSSAVLLLSALATGTPLTGYAPVNTVSALCLAIFPTILGHGLIAWAVRYLAPVYISMNKLFIPIGASLLAYFLFGVLPTVPQAAGSAVVLAGLALYLSAGAGAGASPEDASEVSP
ncbi:MAG TPA: DMT family transporter [Oscillospiraceae bacterium]|nr:DMT family transporter [Oscillospiraceae bacterium]